MPLRVAILFEFSSLNGGERSMLCALEHMDPGTLHPVALAPTAGPLAEELAARGLRHVPFDLFEGGVRKPPEQLQEDLADAVAVADVQLVHGNSLSMGVLLGRTELDVPTVSHLRDIISLSRRAITLLNQNTLLIAVSAATRESHCAQGLDPDRVQVLHNGVDTNLFARCPKTGRLAAELALPAGSRIALTIGQIGLRKGLDCLLDAAAEIVITCPDIHFVMCGRRYSRKEESRAHEEELRRRSDEGVLAGHVHWVGERTDVPMLMNEADMLIHAARQEPLGRVLLEAAASGLPIVATDVGGTTEIVEHEQSALLVAAGDHAALAAAVRRLADDGNLSSRLADAARARVSAEFTAHRAARGLQLLWGGVVSADV